MDILSRTRLQFNPPGVATTPASSPGGQSHRAIDVTNIRPGVGDVVAVCDVKIGGLTVRGVGVRRQLDGNAILVFPSYRSGDGWIDIVSINSPHLNDAVRSTVLTEVAKVVADE